VAAAIFEPIGDGPSYFMYMPPATLDAASSVDDSLLVERAQRERS
jgi:hypothetical protein